MQQQHADAVKHGADLGFGLTAGAALLDVAPKVAALCAVIWYVLRFGEWVFAKWRLWKAWRDSRSG